MNAETAVTKAPRWKPRSWLWPIGLLLMIVAALIVVFVQRAEAAASQQAWQMARIGLPLGRHSPRAVDSRGRVWFYTGTGLVAYTLDGQLAQTLPVPDAAQLGADPAQVRVAVSPNGDPWLAPLSDNLVLHDEQGRWTTYATYSSTDKMTASELVVDGRGVGWLSAAGISPLCDLVQFDPHAAGPMIERRGPNYSDPACNQLDSDYEVDFIAVDPTGHFWFLFGDSNLYETVDGEHWSRTPTDLSSNGLPPYGVGSCLTFDPRGEPWVCDDTSIPHLVAAGQWQSYSLPSQGQMFPISPNSVATDAAGNIWVGTDGYGLEVRELSGNWKVFTLANSGIDSEKIWVFPMDSQGTVWADTGSQLYRLGDQQVNPSPMGGESGPSPRPFWGWSAGCSFCSPLECPNCSWAVRLWRGWRWRQWQSTGLH